MRQAELWIASARRRWYSVGSMKMAFLPLARPSGAPRPRCSTWHVVALLMAAGLWFGPLRASAVSPATLGLRFSLGTPSLTVTGTAGSTWSIQYASSLAPTNVWLVLTNLTLAGSKASAADGASPFKGQRYYRAALVQTLTNAVATNLAWIAPGTFVMGSPANEPGRDSDETQHTVALTKGFYMSTNLVTQDEYLAVMGDNPSYFNGVRNGTDYGTDLNRPVEYVNWYLASDYCALLTEQQQQAGAIPTNWVYRLPTESEWEYACRAGSTNEFSYGEDPTYTNLVNYAWYDADSDGVTQDVGQLLPNGFGLYDMEGDVYEWCQDWYGAYPAGPVANPQGPSSGEYRVFRGGSWDDSPMYCRCAGRYSANPVSDLDIVGFRVVLAPAQ
jgi:formylglycine-generating enzyme required for sulfatase activity